MVTFLSVSYYDKVSMFYSKVLNSKTICMCYSCTGLLGKAETNIDILWHKVRFLIKLIKKMLKKQDYF